MTTPSTAWRRDASAKALGIIAEGQAVWQRLNILGDRITTENANLERAKQRLMQHQASARPRPAPRPAAAAGAEPAAADYIPDIDAQLQGDVDHFRGRLDVLIKQRDDVTASQGALMRLAGEVKEISRKLDLEAHE